MENNLADLGGERGVLAGICQYGREAYLECSELLTGQSFTQHVNRVLYDVLSHIYKKDLNTKIDLAVISSASKEVGLHQELSNEIKYISELFDFYIELSNVRSLAIKLRKLYEARELLSKMDETCQKIRNISGDESISEIISIAETPIFEFSNKIVTGNSKIESLGEGVDEYLEGIDPNITERGISIGFPKFQEAVGYLTSGVHIIGAFLKVGKSFHSQNSALNAGKAKVKVLLTDTELNKRQGVLDRILSRMTGIDVNDIRFGSYKKDPNKVEQITKYANYLKKMPIDYVNITDKTWEEYLSYVRRWLLSRVGYDNEGKLNPCLVILDYIKLTDSKSLSKNIAEHQELGFRLESLHKLCAQYNFPILAYAQLNREQDIASSLRLQWFCTSYSVMSKKQPEEMGEDGPQNGNLKIKPTYCRFGAGMDDNDYICYNFKGRLALIKELRTYQEIVRERG